MTMRPPSAFKGTEGAIPSNFAAAPNAEAATRETASEEKTNNRWAAWPRTLTRRSETEHTANRGGLRKTRPAAAEFPVGDQKRVHGFLVKREGVITGRFSQSEGLRVVSVGSRDCQGFVMDGVILFGPLADILVCHSKRSAESSRRGGVGFGERERPHGFFAALSKRHVRGHP